MSNDKMKDTIQQSIINDHLTKLVEECRTLMFHDPNYMPDIPSYTHSINETLKEFQDKMEFQQETIKVLENKLWELENK